MPFLLFWDGTSSLLKFKATILFFCLMVYIMELAALPVYCMPVQKEKSACTRKTESPCIRKTERACARKTNDSPCKKPVSDCNNSTANCCLNCPLCYVVTMPGDVLDGELPDPVNKEYSLYQSNYLFIYCSTTWKPPNAR